MKKVLIAAPVHPVLIDGLTKRGYQCVIREKITQDAAYALICDCIGVVTSTRLQLDRPLIDAAPQLEWIARMGSGMEVVDVEYARIKNIQCFSSPEGNCNAVAEHALGMLLALVRCIAVGNGEIREGIWKREENRGTELEGKTIAIIGFGHTGAALAKKLQGFDMRILAFDKYDTSRITNDIVKCETLQPVFSEADIVSFHVPVQADTIHYFDEDFVGSMRKSFFLLNTSRGPVVDTVALLNGLRNGKVAGACLDVFEEEPLTAMNPGLRSMVNAFAAMPNVILTPHIAGYTFEAVYKMSIALLNKIPGPALT